MATPFYNGIELVPTASSGAPSSGTHDEGELIVDSAGDLYLCQTAGSPGTWIKVNASSTPTGTGFVHVTSGTQDGAAKLVDTADVNANQITNAKMAQMAAHTFKGNNTGSTANAIDLTETQLAAELAGTSATTLCVGNDARLADARTPTAHATTHSSAGSDPITVSNLAGSVAAAQMPALTGDVTTSAGTVATTLANSGVTAATYGDAINIPSIAVDVKGRITSATTIPSVAYVRVLWGENDLTLSGEQTVDGVALVDGDRIAVGEQPVSDGDGIWIVHTGDWTRAPDADTYAKVVGRIVVADEGTKYALKPYMFVGVSNGVFGNDLFLKLMNTTMGSFPGGAGDVDFTGLASGFDATITSGAVTLAKMANLATAHIIGRNTAGTGVPESLATLPTGCMPALTGDVTNTGGSLATTIANNAVTLAKMADIATASVLGRNTAGTGDPEVLTTIPTGVVPAFTGDVTNSAGSLATTIATAAVTLAKMANLATAHIIGRNTAGTGVPESLATLPTGCVPAFTGDVTTAGGALATTIATSAVTLAKMADLATAHIIGRNTAGTGVPESLATLPTGCMPALTGDVTTAGGALATTIANSAVTLAKMANVATASILGRNTASTGVVEVLSTIPTGTVPAFTGDVTTAGGALATTIAANAVTLAKMATVSTATLLGRNTAGTGNVESLTTIPTGTMPALTGDVTNSAGSLATTIAANAVTLAKMATVSTATVLGRNTAGTGNVESLTTIPTGVVPAFTGDVTNSAGSLATTIATAAVTLAKMANVATATFIGRTTAGTGVPEAMTVTQSAALLAGTSSTTLCVGNDARLGTGCEDNERVFKSTLSNHATGFLTISGTAYFVYVGRVTTTFTPKFVEFHVSTGGTGTQTAEVGLFSTTTGPNKTGLSMTKIVSTGTVDSMNSTGVKRNTSAFATSVTAGTHLWAGIRTAQNTTQPTFVALAYDMSQGLVQSTVSSGVLTGTGPFTGAIIAIATTQICPDLRITLD